MTKEQLFERIKEITNADICVNDDGGIEIYVDYRDELCDSAIKDIMRADDPRQVFEETLCEWAYDYAWQYGWSHFKEDIKSELTDEELECWEENSSEVDDYLQENYFFYYPASHFNKDVCVNIMVDTGDMNYDFTCNNILNWYGRNGYGNKGEIDRDSSILWLAKTQKKATKLRKACKNYYREDGDYVNRAADTDTFIESVVRELENLTSHMAGLTFLVKMPLFDLFELKEAMKAEEHLNKSYYAEKRKGTGYIVLGKETMCGLFNTWSGGGSLLEIELDNDVKLPIKYIFNAWVDGTKPYGWDIDEVYGLVGSAWKETVKEICPMKESEVV